ncbi:hypothetical protein FO519_001158 [Halicephalobus sp. NKZ332]|nr:hypothetical protein FO519_001158 [Halicephalobus sp. NKZ332]
MKTYLLVILLIGAVALTSAAKKNKAEKVAEVDELEGLLDEIDDSKKERDVSEKTPKFEGPNPCEDHVCGWGKECVVDKKNRPICECISKCPEVEDPTDHVCGSNNQTFSSLCELYRQRCICKRSGKDKKSCEDPAFAKIHLEYLGACKELDICTDELMAQFPERMSDWLFQVMKELKKRRELHNLEWEELLSEAEGDDEKKHVYPVIWKFCDLDIKPHDKSVSHHELIPITAPVIPMESCIKPFLERCDANKDGSITIKEWGKCLGLKEGEIQERC